MARDPNAIRDALNDLVQPQARNRLLARGLARGMVWRDGQIPEGGPSFVDSLSADLLDFGYGVLALALELRDANRERPVAERFNTQEAFRAAAEAIESAVRRGDPTDVDQGRHLVVSSAAFHLAGFAARSFSLLPRPALDKNLSTTERALGLLLRRDLLGLRAHIVAWLAEPAHSDETIAKRLADENDSFAPEDAAIVALGATYHRGLGLADTALLFGDAEMFQQSVTALEEVVVASSTVGNVPIWWVATLTVNLLRDLWDHSLHVRLPSGPAPNLPLRWDGLRNDFIAQLSTRRPPHIDLWPSQLVAAQRATDPNDDLVIALPTSAGKTRIAELCILRALADGKRTIYVTPLRALSAQVERVLARTFVPLGATVTSLYGASGATLVDAKTLASADVVVATPEKLDFALRQDPEVLDDVSLIVFDEGHMIGLGSREIRYEVLIQRLLRRSDASQRRIVCLSAMFNPDDPYFQDFGKWLRSDDSGEFVHVRWRPTRQRLATLDWNARYQTARLAFVEGEEAFVPRFFEGSPPRKARKNSFPFNEIEFCIGSANAFARDGHNVLVYSPQRNQVEPLVREFRHMHKQGYLDHVKAPEPQQIAVGLAIGREWLGENHPAVQGLVIGVGTHHGALPRPFLNAVEELIDARHLQVVVASPTLAQGIDIACSVLIFRSLQRFNMEAHKQVAISPAEFANVLGRAGRAYVDLDGIAVLPSFESGWQRSMRHKQFNDLVKLSRGQRLASGIAQLIAEIIVRLSTRLDVVVDELSEYVLNQRDMWTDPRLITKKVEESEGEDEAGNTLEEYLADLDVALLALIDDLNAPVESLADLLDDMLKDSLWKRTLAHAKKAIATLERDVLISRAEWIWRTTTTTQRRACFFAGLGRQTGVFLYERLDTLVELLTTFHNAIVQDDEAAAASAAVHFAQEVMEEPFFSVKKLPSDWQAIIKKWVTGFPFADILDGRQIRDMQRTQSFVQDGVVFRLVWAAEAVRVQAIATMHPRAKELGDGPAFAMTYGMPSIPAALLCQMGFASRMGALFAARKLSASFNDLKGMRRWIRKHGAVLVKPDFWDSADHHLLWINTMAPTGREYPRAWKREDYVISVKWNDTLRPLDGKRVRLITSRNRLAVLCATDLTPLGSLTLPFDPEGAALDARVTGPDQVQVSYFGPSP